MLKILKQEGFASIIEVIISSIIFIIAAAGILTAVSTFQSQAGGNTSKRLEAVYAGKQVIDELRSEVDAETWDSGNLTTGLHSTTVLGYDVNYYLTDVPSGCAAWGGCIARKMTMNIYYDD